MSLTNLLDNVITQVHDPVTGRIDAILFGEFLDIKVKDMAKIVGGSPAGLRKNPTSEKFRPALNKLYVLIDNVRALCDGSMKDALSWLNAPNPYLGNKTPLSCIEENKSKEVEDLVNAMETGRLV